MEDIKEKKDRNRQPFVNLDRHNKFNTTSIAKLMILNILMDKGSHYGQEIIDEITRSMGGTWSPSPGLVYPLLRNLEGDLFVTGDWDEPDKKSKRRYRITNEGIKHFNFISSNYFTIMSDSVKMLDNVVKTVYKKSILEGYAKK